MGCFFTNGYDFFMGPLEKWKFTRIRKNLLKEATGHVLEIGAGTGVNFPLYKNAERVTAVEPSNDMIERSKTKKALSDVPIEVVKASAEQLPFADQTFDSVVATLVFCTIPHPEAAINEIRRVCKQEGEILFFEHVKMDNPVLFSLQNWLTPIWKKVCDGCCLNRDTLQLIKSHGITVYEMEKYLKGLFIVVKAKNGQSYLKN